eukprot:386157-Pyramimonas_sp.AAC.1
MHPLSSAAQPPLTPSLFPHIHRPRAGIYRLPSCDWFLRPGIYRLPSCDWFSHAPSNAGAEGRAAVAGAARCAHRQRSRPAHRARHHPLGQA